MEKSIVNFLMQINWLGVWGAVLSTILAVLKFNEWWRDRQRIDASFTYISDPYKGNIILIRNLSNRQILIAYWEVFAAFDKKGTQNPIALACAASRGSTDLPIAPNFFYELILAEQEHFPISEKFLKGRPIYLKLDIAGMRPITRKIYPFPGE